MQEVYAELEHMTMDADSFAWEIQEELDMVKSYMLGDLSRSYEGPFSLSDAWIYVETAGLDDEFFVRFMDAVRNVTCEDVRLMAQKYLCRETLIDVVAGKKM